MRIIKDELKNGGIAKTVDLLTECENNLNLVILSLDDFISDSYLNSTLYDKIKSLIGQYRDLLTKDKQIAGEFSQLIDLTTSNMTSYMEEFQEINDAKKAEISDSILALKNSIVEYNAVVETLSSDEESINEMNAIIQAKNNAQTSLDYYNKLLDKINNLTSYDCSEYSRLDGVSNELTSMKANLSDMASME